MDRKGHDVSQGGRKALICPECHRVYQDPVKFHRHLLQELRRVEEEFRELRRESARRLGMMKLLSLKATKGVNP